MINVALLFSQLSGTQTSERKRQPIERLAKPDFGATAAKANFVRLVAIGAERSESPAPALRVERHWRPFADLGRLWACCGAARHCGLSLQPQNSTVGEFTQCGQKRPSLPSLQCPQAAFSGWIDFCAASQNSQASHHHIFPFWVACILAPDKRA